MNEIFYFRNPIPKILEAAHSVNISEISQDDPNYKIYALNPLPIFPKHLIDLLDGPTETGASAIKTLLSIGYCFPFFPNILDFYQQPNFSVCKPENYKTCFIMFNAISWFSYYLITGDTSYAEKVLRSLIGIINSSLQSLTASLFSLIFKSIIDSCSAVNLAQYIETLILFFSTPLNHPPEITQLIPAVLGKTIDHTTIELSADSQKILSSVADWMKSFTIEASVMEQIIAMISVQILHLDLFSLKFLHLVLKTTSTPKETFTELFRMLPSKICICFRDEQNQLNWKTKADLVELPVNISLDGALGFGGDLAYGEKFEFVDNISFPIPTDINCFINKESNRPIEYLLQILVESQQYSEVFITNLFEETNKYKDDQCIGNIVAGTLIFSGGLPSKLTLGDLLINLIIFDPQHTYFSNTENFETLNSLRHSALQMILQCDSSALDKLLINNYQYPLFIAEINYRLIGLSDLFGELIQKSPRLLKSIRIIFTYYRNIHMTRMENQREIKVARESILKLISKLIEKPKTAATFFRDQPFLTTYLTLFYEIPLRRYALSNILSVIEMLGNGTQIQKDIVSIIIFSFSNIIATAVPMRDDSRYIDLVIAVLESIEESYKVCRPIFEYLYVINEQLSKLIIALTPSKNSQDFFVTIIKYYITIHEDYIITVADLNMFREAIKNIFNGEPSGDIYKLMIRFMKCDFEADLSPNFKIEQPVLLLLFLQTFQKSEYFLDVVDFVSSVLKFDPSNPKKSSECEVDMFLLEMISDAKDNNQSEIVAPLLNLFKQIASVVAPPAVVKKFVSLLAPVSNTLSNYHIQFMNTLRELISDLYNRRKITRRAGDGFLTDFDFNDDFSDGLTISTWLFISSSRDDVIPLAFIEFDEAILQISVQKDKIVLNHIVDEIQTQVESKPLNLNVWSNISISYVTFQSQVAVCFKNGLLETKLDALPLFDMKGAGHIRLGCKLPKQVDYIEIGTSIIMHTPQKTKKKLQSDYSYHSPMRLPNLNGFNVVAKYECQINKNNDFSENDRESFAFSLVKMWKIDILLPIFALFDVPFADGTLWAQGPTTAISILQRALMCSVAAERLFAGAEKFEYIAHLLLTYKAPIISYDLYLQFFSLFQSLSYGQLMEQMFRTILASTELWMSAKNEDHLKILGHWSTTLFPAASSFIVEACPFKSMIEMLVLFYWFKPDRKTSFGAPDSPNPRDPNLKVELARIEILKCAQLIAERSFTAEDLIMIFRTCQSVVDDDDQIESLLFFAETLLQTLSCDIKLTIDDLSPLHVLVARHVEKITMRIFKLTAAMFRKETLPHEAILNFLDALIFSIPPSTVTDWFFGQAISMLYQSTPEFLSLCCWYAVNKEETSSNEELCKALQILHPSPDFAISSTWYIWPIILASKAQPHQRTIIVSFLTACKTSELNRLLCGIEIVCRALRESTDDLKSKFLNDICTELLSRKFSIQNQSLIQFINHVIFFILCREEPNLAISKMMEYAGYDDNKTEPNSSPIQKKNISGFQFAYSFNHINFDEITYQFGFRFDEEGQWMDNILAVNVTQLIIKSKLSLFYPIATYLCCLLVRSIPGSVKALLGELPKSHIKEYAESKLNHNIAPIPLQIVMMEKELSALTQTTDLSKEVLNDIIRNNHIINKIAENFVNHIDKFTEVDEQAMQAARQKITIHRREIARKWAQVFSPMSSEKGPWDIHLEQQQMKLRRDSTACFSFCPYRMKINKHFDIHKDASEARDNAATQSGNHSKKVEKEDEEKIIIPELPENTIVGQCLLSVECKIIKPSGNKKGVFKLMKNMISIIHENNDVTIINIPDLQYAFHRTRYHKPTAIEFITYNGHTTFINFLHIENSLSILHLIKKQIPQHITIQLQPFAQYFNSLRYRDLWATGKISNFEYLMMLNVYSGRSFQDLAQYPIFPIVLIDTKSDSLNFADESIYRDLTKPIGALDENRLIALKNEMEERDLDIINRKYLYSSGPVSRLTICLSLIRLEPFATLHIKLQSGRFDVADRQFASIDDFIKSTTGTNQSDFREMTPEFYFLPDFLLNSNEFNLGKRINGTVNHVELPPWANGNALNYVYLNRKALESDYVSMYLDQWIDLMWGYKQTGEEAEKADNLYNPKLYEDVWEQDNTLLTEAQIKAFLNMIGQIPPQLFREKHPPRSFNNVLKIKELLQFKSGVSNVLHAQIDNNTLYFFCADASIHVFAESHSNGFEIKKVAIAEIKRQQLVDIVSKGDLLFCSPTPRHILVCSKNYPSLVLVNIPNAVAGGRNATSQIPSPHISVEHTAADGGWFSTSGVENCSHAYRFEHPKKIVFSFQSYRDSMTCSCISDTFKVHVSGTRDGALIVTSLTNGVTTHVMDVSPAVPQRVLVTRAWGFIVALLEARENGLSAHYIVVFTINGEEVRRNKIDADVVDWITFASERGFDYVAIVTALGKVLFAEVYYMNFSLLLPVFKPPLCGLFYSHSTQSLVAVNPSGHIVYAPCAPQSW